MNTASGRVLSIALMRAIPSEALHECHYRLCLVARAICYELAQSELFL